MNGPVIVIQTALLCTFLEFYTHLEANSAKSFQNAFCKCSKALNIVSKNIVFLMLRVLRDFQKYSTKSVSLGSPNKGLNYEGKILAYKKNKLRLISYSLYEEC